MLHVLSWTTKGYCLLLAVACCCFSYYMMTKCVLLLFVTVALSFSVAFVVEDVLQQHGTRLKDLDLESRKAEEVVELSEEEFRLGLRNGIILCNVLKKVVESPYDCAVIPHAAPLSAILEVQGSSQ
ncbi:hypothetical protein RIF29_10054 [Crotalaria pallida]|uniref:Calponin-homology (CH) domain-containing protein n=1 Tax=Crotalaria pallida TaxID=3830 RepID=A0AAN9IJQ0_CROPI